MNEIEKNDFNSFSKIIISGSPTLLTKVNLQKFIKPFKFIKTIDIPILGICLGHQIIGLLYGAEIQAGKRIDKKERIEIIKENDLFKNIKNFSLFKQAHCESITLPTEFILLAKSKSCENEAMKHKNKKIYGVQFHPEVSEKNGKKLFDNFVKITKSL